MRFHRSLTIIVAANFICTVIAFYLLRKYGDEDTRLLGNGIGWIFWLGIYVIVSPLFLTDSTRGTLFSKKYIGGTLLLCFLLLLLTIAGVIVANLLIP